jgi:hypothetical protein
MGGFNPPAPAFQAPPPPPQAGQPPPWNQPGANGPQPWHPQGYGPQAPQAQGWGPPPYSHQGYGQQPWGQAPPYYGQQLPPQIPLGGAAAFGTDPQVVAKLQALETQNAQLREAEIRRESNSAVMQMMTEMRAYQQQSELRFQQMVEKLQAPRAGDDTRHQIEREGQQRREEMARIDHQRQVDSLRVEMQRVSDNAKSSEDRFRMEMSGAKESGNNQLMQQLLTQFHASTQQSQNQMLGLFTQIQNREMKPETFIALAREMTPSRDPMTEKLFNIAVESLMGGSGGPSMPQVVGELGKSLIDGAGKITTAIVESKGMEERSKLAAEQRTQARAQQVAQQARQVVVAQPAVLPRNGSHPVAAVPAEAQVAPRADSLGNPVLDDDTAVQQLEADERRYFGDAYSSVAQLRNYVTAKLVTPEKAASVLAEAWVYFTNMNVQIAALVDLGAFNEAKEFVAGDHHKLVTRTLPDAEPAFRRQVVEHLPGAIDTVILDDDEEEGDEAPAGVPQ